MRRPVPGSKLGDPALLPGGGTAAALPGDAALRQSEQRLEFALHAGRMGSWELDLATMQFTSSAHAREVFGLGPDDPFERFEDVVALIHPDDQADRMAAVERAISEGGELDMEYRTRRTDGQYGWVLARGRAVVEGGRPVRLVGVSLDITDRKMAEERQKLLLAELNHRVKNTLATVQSIAMQTLRNATEPSVFDLAFVERLHALAQAHDLLTEAAWEGASLAEVIGRTLKLRVARDENHRVTYSGPAMRLSPNAAVTLNMVFHELATNAARHGALSTPTGRVDVVWTLDPEGREITLDWRESGGPAVTVPERRGFGSRLIEQALPREMGGETLLSYQADGLTCRMRMPLSTKLSLVSP